MVQRYKFTLTKQSAIALSEAPNQIILCGQRPIQSISLQLPSLARNFLKIKQRSLILSPHFRVWSLDIEASPDTRDSGCQTGCQRHLLGGGFLHTQGHTVLSWYNRTNPTKPLSSLTAVENSWTFQKGFFKEGRPSGAGLFSDTKRLQVKMYVWYNCS